MDYLYWQLRGIHYHKVDKIIFYFKPLKDCEEEKRKEGKKKKPEKNRSQTKIKIEKKRQVFNTDHQKENKNNIIYSTMFNERHKILTKGQAAQSPFQRELVAGWIYGHW